MRSWNPIEGVWVFVLGLLLASNGSRASCPGGHFTATSATGHIEAGTGPDYSVICRDVDDFIWPGNPGAEAECGDPCANPVCSCDGPCALARASFQPQTDGYVVDIVAAVGKNPDSHGGTGPGSGILPRSAVARPVYVTGEAVGGMVQCTFTGQWEYGVSGRIGTYPIADVQNFYEGVINMPEPNGAYCYVMSGGVTDPTDPNDPAKQAAQVHCFYTVICQPYIPPSQNFSWNALQGGNYSDSSNWTPNCGVPEHNGQVSDIAYFTLANAQFIPVSGFGATAGQWVVLNGCPIAFGGTAELSSTSDTNPSLRILQGGQLRLVSGASLDAVHTSVGASGATNSKLEVKGGWWTNAESAKIGRGSIDVLDGGTASTKVLTIGSGNGPGAVHVTGDASSFDVSGELSTIGKTTAGTLEIDKGIFSFTSLADDPVIGESAPGTVTVRGDDSSPGSRGIFQVRTSLWIGILASGRLDIQRGGSALIGKDIFLNDFGVGSDSALFVDGQGGSAFLSISGALHVGATQQVGVLVDNGGVISAQGLKVGWRGGTGTADFTIRGRQTAPNMPSRLWVTDQPGDPGPVENVIVGASAPGQLNIQAGASADLEGGLTVGESAPGTVIVSGLNAPPSTFSTLTVTSETRVGIGAAGIVQLDEGAIMENDGDLTIGLGGGHPSGSVTVDDAALLFVHGTLSVGASGGEGLLEIGDHSGVACDTLLVGGNTLQAGGTIILQDDFAELFVSGNVQVGVSVGSGLIEIDDECVLRLNGAMTIGNPNRGPFGNGKVSLNDATIESTDIILVNRNGRLEGTGRVAAPTLNAGGYIAPGLSPGTLTIDGDYEQLPTGVLVIEYAGWNPGEFDVLHVTGQTTLGGRLEVHFRGGFSPDDPAAFIQSQSFVEADGVITGDYDQRIYAFPDLFADFDDDGDKDLSDVAAFQNCFGLSGAELEPACARADWESDGVIGGREIQELSGRLTGP